MALESSHRLPPPHTRAHSKRNAPPRQDRTEEYNLGSELAPEKRTGRDRGRRVKYKYIRFIYPTMHRLCYLYPVLGSGNAPPAPAECRYFRIYRQGQYKTEEGKMGGRSYGKGFSSIGRHVRNAKKAIAAWKMKTARKASAYESTAAFFHTGSRSRILSAEWLQGGGKPIE